MARTGSRLTTVVVTAAILAIAAVAAWAAADVGRDDTHAAEPGGRATATAAGIPSRPDDAVALTVTYVFDGDTIEVAEPSAGGRIRVRLIGIDTPEGTPAPECWADEARAHLAELLPEGATVWSAPDAEPNDRYGRALRYLWTDDGRFVNYELVAAGDAETLRIAPNTAHADLFAAAQVEAEAVRAGQWGAC
ncbi:thermonuclease family protein [Microbacterium kyungheense]|uniref:Micrococcal nuclease n=1 Tax=Microbacterium kyungheense TaxID=1263636 RepID=A0A543FJ97_9MICO|nr:thermonuclease family protein [Microbacterium kyungheense]TQM33947.1 micrococcal nuclease [Microbacterium kyungheense]